MLPQQILLNTFTSSLEQFSEALALLSDLGSKGVTTVRFDRLRVGTLEMLHRIGCEINRVPVSRDSEESVWEVSFVDWCDRVKKPQSEQVSEDGSEEDDDVDEDEAMKHRTYNIEHKSPGYEFHPDAFIHTNNVVEDDGAIIESVWASLFVMLEEFGYHHLRYPSLLLMHPADYEMYMDEADDKTNTHSST